MGIKFATEMARLLLLPFFCASVQGHLANISAAVPIVDLNVGLLNWTGYLVLAALIVERILDRWTRIDPTRLAEAQCNHTLTRSKSCEASPSETSGLSHTMPLRRTHSLLHMESESNKSCERPPPRRGRRDIEEELVQMAVFSLSETHVSSPEIIPGTPGQKVSVPTSPGSIVRIDIAESGSRAQRSVNSPSRCWAAWQGTGSSHLATHDPGAGMKRVRATPQRLFQSRSEMVADAKMAEMEFEMNAIKTGKQSAEGDELACRAAEVATIRAEAAKKRAEAELVVVRLRADQYQEALLAAQMEMKELKEQFAVLRTESLNHGMVTTSGNLLISTRKDNHSEVSTPRVLSPSGWAAHQKIITPTALGQLSRLPAAA